MTALAATGVVSALTLGGWAVLALGVATLTALCWVVADPGRTSRLTAIIRATRRR